MRRKGRIVEDGKEGREKRGCGTVKEGAKNRKRRKKGERGRRGIFGKDISQHLGQRGGKG